MSVGYLAEFEAIVPSGGPSAWRLDQLTAKDEKALRQYDAFEHEVLASLDERQTRRLYQLCLQQSGQRLLDAKIARMELGLSEEQLAQIRELRLEAARSVRNFWDAPYKSSEAAAYASSFEWKLCEDNLAAIPATVLTKDQLQHWQEMKGKPFKD